MNLNTIMKHGFKAMCDVHEATKDLVCFFLFMQSCIFYYINVYILITLYFYICSQMRGWSNMKHKRINKILC
jgi:hypothetical protein